MSFSEVVPPLSTNLQNLQAYIKLYMYTFFVNFVGLSDANCLTFSKRSAVGSQNDQETVFLF